MLLAVIVIVGIGGFLLLKEEVKEVPIPPSIPLPSISAIAEARIVRTRYSIGDTLRHNETGQVVKIVQVPPIVNGEYIIRWPSGAIGEIHQAQLISWFTKI